MTGGQIPDQSRSALSALLRRETIILMVLAAATAPLFFFTRTMAAWNRESNISAGRVWYERAQEPLRQGISKTAIDDLRKATAADRDNLQYSLSLAEELITVEQTTEARQILLRLRDSRPEDGRINLDLARLSVKDDEVEVARKYYHQALYGMWPTGQVETEQSKIRMEFVRFLMTQRDTSNAVSELLVLATNSPADAASKTELGRLFLQAEEPLRARNQFFEALRLDPKSASALSGSGEAEFKLGNDDAARKQLQRAAQQGPLPPESQRALDLAGLILSNDPLATGIGARERERRLTQALRQAGDRLEVCGNQSAFADPGTVEAFKSEAMRIGQQVSRNGSATDLDLLRDGLRIASRAETSAKETCGRASDADEAIILAAERHKVNVQ